MLTTYVCRCLALIALIGALTGCSGGNSVVGPAPVTQGLGTTVPAAPPAATAATVTPVTSSPAPPAAFQPITASARVFEYSVAQSSAAAFTRNSRIVLYDTGSFSLQFAGIGEYTGTYVLDGRDLYLSWDGWSKAGPWESSATLVDDVLSIRYGTVMQLTDFEDATYTLVR